MERSTSSQTGYTNTTLVHALIHWGDYPSRLFESGILHDRECLDYDLHKNDQTGHPRQKRDGILPCPPYQWQGVLLRQSGG